MVLGALPIYCYVQDRRTRSAQQCNRIVKVTLADHGHRTWGARSDFAVGEIIAFSEATFSTFGVVENIGK